MKKIQNRSAFLAAILAVGFAVSLIPVLMASFYIHPALDDFGNSAHVHAAIVNGGGILSALKAAAETAVSYYYGWQGTFAAVFILALQPGVWGDEYYFLSTFILLGALISSTVFLMHTIFVRWLKMRKSQMWILTLLVLFLQIQFLPDIAEGYFWFNGSALYTLFYSLSLVLTALLINVLLTQDLGKTRWITAAAMMTAFLIGGGNYSTALMSICMIVLAIALLICKKNRKSKIFLLVSAVMLISFAINVTAPGTQVRASYTAQMNPVLAVANSLHHAMEDLGRWATLEKVIALLAVSPLVYRAAGNCNWKFRYPFLVFVIAFGLYACQKTPVLYAMSYEGEGRQRNIYYYSFILMLLFVMFYLSGWIQRKYPDMISVDHVLRAARRHMISAVMVLGILFLAGCLNRDIRDLTSAQCAMWIANGYAKAYDETYAANIARAEAADGAAYLEELEKRPPIFMVSGLSEDSTYWVNGQWAQYYQCEKVYLLPAEETEQ